MRRVLSASVLFLLITHTVFAQSPALVTGRVLAEPSRQPVAGVIVRGAGASVETDADGRFTLSLPAGTTGSVRLLTAAPGYLDQQVEVPVLGGRAEVEILLVLNPAYQEEVQVTAPALADAIAPPPTIVLEPVQVTRVAGSGDNVFRVLQALPGVSATDDFGSRLAVRGGGPDQNLTMMDGVEIHNPYRLFGLTSAFNPETIERFELTAGGFSPKYGDRLSSILLVDNRPGTSARSFAGSGAVSLTDTNLVLEGKMPSGSWLVTGRRTYYDVLAERITDNDLPSFADVQAKATWRLAQGRELTVFALGSREATDAAFDGEFTGDQIGLKDDSKNDVVSLRFTTPIGRRASSRTVAAWYRYGDELSVDAAIRSEAVRSNGADDDEAFNQAQFGFTRGLGVRDLSLREEVTIAPTPTHTISTGFEAHALTTDWRWALSGDRNPSAANGSSVQGGTGLPSRLDSSAASARAGAWLEDEVQIHPRARVAGGIRVDWSQLARETIVAPRLRTTIDLAPRTKLRVAAGLFTQSPGYEKLLQSDYFVDLSDSSSLGLKSERSWHLIGGLERTFGGAVTARAEGWYKTFDRMIAGRLETPQETAARVAQYAFPAALRSSVPIDPQVTSFATNDAVGRSYGLDVFIEKKAQTVQDRISGWVAYTWGRAYTEKYGLTYPFDYDRRHALSIVSTWRMFPRVSLGGTLRVATGFPFTSPVGLRVAPVLAPGAVDGAPGSLVPRVDGNGLSMWTTDYGGVDNLNQARLPLYARLDLRVTYMTSPTSRWQLYGEAINALNRQNASSISPQLDYDPSSDRPQLSLEPQGGLPLFPSVGFRIRF